MNTDNTLHPIDPEPNPCHRIGDPDLVEMMRRLDCRFYDQCLAIATERGWRSFHCNGCAGYEAPTAAEQRRDYIGALTLLAESQLLPSLRLDDVATDEQEDSDED